ncbi:MAG: CdiI family contact-dependent growth inhibition immunity protein [Bacteroidales bacterium]|nr:CdiI family contact-dependent growth inhibition immunity protein [Bacteroidales bacterium]
MKKLNLVTMFENLFRKHSDNNKKLKESKRLISIYKTMKHYAILTAYQTESGIWLFSDPVYILSLDITEEEFAKVISDGLAHSRSISEKEENIFRSNNKLLKRMKERSWSNLYKTSKSCTIEIENNEIIIEPWILSSTQRGLVSDEERVVKLEFSKSNYVDVAQIVIDILT